MGISRANVKPLEDIPPVVFVKNLPAPGMKSCYTVRGPSWWKAVANQLKANPGHWGELPTNMVRADLARRCLEGYLIRHGYVETATRQGKIYARYVPA